MLEDRTSDRNIAGGGGMGSKTNEGAQLVSQVKWNQAFVHCDFIVGGPPLSGPAQQIC
jgi:hypothetical protein